MYLAVEMLVRKGGSHVTGALRSSQGVLDELAPDGKGRKKAVLEQPAQAPPYIRRWVHRLAHTVQVQICHLVVPCACALPFPL